MLFVSKVKDVFQITGRGVVIVLDRETWVPDAKIRNADRIQLRTPDGRTLDTEITSIEFLSGSKVHSDVAILLPRNVSKDQVPPESEIWLMHPL